MNTLQISTESSWLVHAGAAAILYIHIAGGSLGIVSGTAALVFRKGSRLHALAGRIFVASMLVMTSIGAAVAPFLISAHGDPKLFDAIGGLATFYLVATGWMTVKRKAGTIGAFEIAACALGFLLAAATISLGMVAYASPDGFAGGSGAKGFFFQGGIIAFASALDLKIVLKGGIAGIPRIARHVWRVGLALLIAMISFFLGLQRVMPEFIQGSPFLFFPPLAVFAIILFWLVRLRFGKRLRGAFAALGGHRAASCPGVGNAGGRLAAGPAE
jgi:uncharacterized membrane protein